MTAAEFEKSLICLTVWRLAGTDGLDCMLAVGCCLANRVKLEKLSWLAVVEEATIPGSFPDSREPLFVKLLQSIDLIYEGKAKDASNGGIKWADLSQEPAPAGLSLCCRVGRMSFFR
jgi:hypothetical protein